MSVGVSARRVWRLISCAVRNWLRKSRPRSCPMVAWAPYPRSGSPAFCAPVAWPSYHARPEVGLSADAHWRRCSSCKREIGFTATYWVCSVSTCNRKRTGLVFCTTSCWDAHLPLMNHREAWAEERRAPTREAYLREQAAEASASSSPQSRGPAPAPRPAAPPPRPAAPVRPPPAPPEEKDVLVVVSKLKAYIRDTSGMNTSDAVAEILSDRLRRLCDQAIRNAQRDGRRTVMERDF